VPIKHLQVDFEALPCDISIVTKNMYRRDVKNIKCLVGDGEG
jgi:hypothetical protein